MKKILLIILLAGAYTLSYSQKVELTKKEIQTIKVLKATLFLKNDHGPLYLDKQDFVFERTKEGNLLVYSKTNPGLPDPIIGDRYHHYLIKVNGSQRGIIEFYDECERNGFIHIERWNGDRPLKTGSRIFDDGEWIYDADNNIKGLSLGQSYRSSKKKRIYRDTRITFGYDKKGRINETNKIVQVYKKSNSSKNLKADYELKERSINFNYEDNKTTSKIIEYRQGKRGSEKSKITKHTLTNDNFQTFKEKIVTILSSKGNHVYESLVRKEYDSNWRLLKKYSEDSGYIRTMDYTYDMNGHVNTEIHETIRRESGNTIKHLTLTNKYDERGLLEEMVSLERKEGDISEKKVTSHKYTAIDTNVPITKCQHKKEFFIRFYDQDDVLFKEVKESKFRIKKDGVWSGWKFFKM